MTEQWDSGDLVELIYAAALEPDGWEEAVRQTAVALDADAALAYLPGRGLTPTDFARDLVGWNLLSIEASTRIALETGRLDAYNEVGRARGLTKPGFIGLGQDYCDDRMMDENPWTELAYKPVDIRHYMGFIGNMPFEDAPAMHFSLFRRTRGTPFSEADLARMARVRPHLERAARMAFRLRIERDRASLARATSDALTSPVLVVGADLRILQFNAAAEVLLREGALLAVRHGKLSASNPADAAGLAKLVSLGLHAGADVWLTGRHNSPCALSATPMVLPSGLRATLVHIVRAAPAGEMPERLVRLFGMTRAEAEVAIAIGEGVSPAELATIRGVTIETIRAQLRAVFAKAEITGQVQLAKLIGQHARLR